MPAPKDGTMLRIGFIHPDLGIGELCRPSGPLLEALV